MALFGAHITSWTTIGAAGLPVERLWMSSCLAMDGSAPIRGGIPIAWPQFANDGALPLHGFVREQPWTVVESADNDDKASTSATLELVDSERTVNGTWREPSVAPFPHKFRLRFKAVLGATYLQLQLQVTNLGPAGEAPAEDAPLLFTTCFHTYFRTADSTQVRLSGGLEGVNFVDKVCTHGSMSG